MSNKTAPIKVDYRTHMIICGYIRDGLKLVSFGSDQIGSELMHIVLSYINDHFMNETHSIHTWNIHLEELNEIFNLNNSQLMCNPITINSITFNLIGKPHNNEILILFLNCIKSQIKFKTIIVSATIECNETLYGDSYIFSFENINQQKPFPSYGLLLNDINNLKYISLNITLNILQIIAINNTIIYQYQPKYNINPESNESFTITINKLLFNQMKNAIFGKCFITHCFYNNNFCLRIFPNGIYGNKESKGNVLIYLQWNGINNIFITNINYIGWKIYISDAHIVNNGMHKINYNSSFINCQIDTLSFDEFKLYNTFGIVIDINCNISNCNNNNNYNEQIISNKLNVLVSCINTLDDRLSKMEKQRLNDINTLYNQFNMNINHINQTLTQQLIIIKNKCYENEKYFKQSIISLQSQINTLQNNKQPFTPIQKFKIWLRDICKLEQYFDIFVKNGFNSIQSIVQLNDNSLKQIGIKKIGHRKKILKYTRNINQNNVKDTDAVVEHKSMVNEVIEEKQSKQIIFKVSNVKTQPMTQKKLKTINWGHKKSRRREKREEKNDENMYENMYENKECLDDINAKPKMCD